MKDFDTLLADLAEEIDVPIQPDKKGGCYLKVEEKYNVQLELENTSEFVILASYLAKLPPGKFRENVLKDALKANWKYATDIGVVSYVENISTLMLHHFEPTRNLNAKSLAATIHLFLKKVRLWVDALESGKSSPYLFDEASSKELPPPPFGLKL